MVICRGNSPQSSAAPTVVCKILQSLFHSLALPYLESSGRPYALCKHWRLERKEASSTRS